MESKHSLSGISLEKQVFATKLAEIEKQLATSVQTQVVETKRALELLESSCKDIKVILSNFEFIDTKSKECKELLHSFSDIKLLSLSRNNLRITKDIQRLFQEIPDRATELETMLERNPDMFMVPVYRNLRRLIRLRDEALKKSKEYDTLDISRFNSVENVALMLENQIRENIDDTLYLSKKEPHVLVNTLKICEMEDRYGENEKILKASSKLWAYWRENGFDVTDSINFELSDHHGTGVVANNNKNNDDNSSKPNNMDGDNDTDDTTATTTTVATTTTTTTTTVVKKKKPQNNDTMQAKVKNEILDLVFGIISQLTASNNNSEEIPNNDNNNDNNNNDNKKRGISTKEFLTRVDEVMEDLNVVIEDAKYCFPPTYHILSYYINNYQNGLTPLILDRIEPNSVPTQERLSVVAWLAKFKTTLEKLDQALSEDETERLNLQNDGNIGSSVQKKIKQDTNKVKQRSDILIKHVCDCEETLLNSYINACRSKLNKWIDNIIDNEKKEEKIFWTKNNIPKTHSPQDLFTALNHQFDVAMEQLRDEQFVKVIKMILQSIDHFRNQLAFFIFTTQKGSVGGGGGGSGNSGGNMGGLKTLDESKDITQFSESDSDSEYGNTPTGAASGIQKNFKRIRGSIQIQSHKQSYDSVGSNNNNYSGDGNTLGAPTPKNGAIDENTENNDDNIDEYHLESMPKIEPRNDEYICAIVNSCYDISEKLRLKSEEIIEENGHKLISSSKARLIDELDSAFDDRVCLFTNMATTCVLNLAKYQIFNDILRPNIIIKLFTKEWLEDDVVVNELAMTLEDYFRDLQAWIEESHFFWEMVKFICDNIYKDYYKQFLKKKPKSFDPDLMGKRITEDLIVIDRLFLDVLDNDVIKKYWNDDGHKRLEAFGGALQADFGFIGGFSQNVISPKGNNVQNDNSNKNTHHHSSNKKIKKSLGEKVWLLVKSIKEKHSKQDPITGEPKKQGVRKFLDKMNS